MNEQMIVSLLAGLTVITLVMGLSLAFRKTVGSHAEQRLDDLTSRPKKDADMRTGILLRPPAIDLETPLFWTKLIPNLENLSRLYEQADVNLPFDQFMGLVVLLSLAGTAIGFLFKLPLYVLPVCAAVLGVTPFLWLVHRKQRRIKLFLEAMPEAVELIGRGLRAGHSLASALHLVSEEMTGPVADEFGRVFDEQNLGIPLEVTLRGLADRVPSVDVRFFVIAVVIQRATGGDLAEVLDKIGKLIRQRFELFGHVRSLTAEGRLSGIVLLALPPGLLAFLSVSNYDYVSVLYTTPLGTKMLAITAALQLLGALMIKKIVAIKV
ncbi:tight adherence protein B [Singulisphaera sp. GP187]|uniref:type II secretion system F family protein n=1 Tax=Singulisphaera sp. GP187 TaxID=1882752 RepID=UPI000928B600|nr:type II secretion system F family protein [Singulisphaera sp. GP187]SIO62629.1 tight adherence protein B [Singulisphaera sp. GP187]